MKEIVVISGKGGTGKTSLTACFAQLANDQTAGKAVLADCDVDAADLHIVLEPRVKEEYGFSGGSKARVIAEKCVGCGKCAKVCRFDAINLTGPSNGLVGKTYEVDEISCEGCGVCVEFCPVGAIEFEECVNGKWFVSETRFGQMVHAKLGIAEENSGKLVTVIRNKAKEIAKANKAEMIIVDGSPGIGCPVIASITGASLIVIVTEPTLSGLHDLERVAKLAELFKVGAVVVVNKFDLNEQIAQEIEERAKEMGLRVAGRVRYDKAFTAAQKIKATVLEYTGGAAAEDIKSVWQQIVYAAG